MRKMLGIFTIAAAAFFLIAVSASATPRSHHHPNVGHHAHHGRNGHEGGNQGGQCGDWGDHQSNGYGGDRGGCQCDNQGDHFGGDQGGDCGGGGTTPPGDGGGDGGSTPPPVVIQPTIDPPSHTFLCYSTFEVDPAVYTFGQAWQLLTSASDHYFTPYAIKGNVQYGTNIGGYHLVCNAGLLGLLAHTSGTPQNYADSDGQVFGQTWADAMASDHGSYNGMTLNVFPVVG